MAMARSLALAPLLLLSVLISTTAAARTTTTAGGGDTVQVACSKSQFPGVCGDGLNPKPESKTATPRQLAELFIGYAVEKGSSIGTFIQGKATSVTVDDKAMVNCYDACGDDVEEAMAHLNGLVREPTDAKFLELKSWLSATLGGTSTCEDACKDLPKNTDKDAVVAISVEFEKLLRVTLDLITQASGSMSADIALPPSDAAAPAAYGAAAAAPFEGYAASSLAEGPAAAGSEGPASPIESEVDGGVASGPSAAADDTPAAAADAPSAGGSASAPAPSGSSAAADAPSGLSAGAPSGDSDAPAPDDGASGDDGSDDSDDDKA